MKLNNIEEYLDILDLMINDMDGTTLNDVNEWLDDIRFYIRKVQNEN